MTNFASINFREIDKNLLNSRKLVHAKISTPNVSPGEKNFPDTVKDKKREKTANSGTSTGNSFFCCILNFSRQGNTLDRQVGIFGRN